MGQELKCRVEFGEQSSEGKALLESTEIVFRGGFRLKIPFQGIQSVLASDGKFHAIAHRHWSSGFDLDLEFRLRNPFSRGVSRRSS
jgi:hypothetical protein